MAFNQAHLVVAALFCLSTLSFIHASIDGFSVDLIRHDSPKSPFYNPNETHFDRLRKAMTRSISRGNYFKAAMLGVSPNDLQSDITNGHGEFLMTVSLGTPPQEIIAIADTGSDVLWTQCKPCEDCFKQNDPLFDPEESSTYRDLSCSSKPCEELGNSQCSDSNSCQYSLQYGDQSYSNGNLASETLTMGDTNSSRSVSIPKTVFGCGHENAGTFNALTSGIVGLGGGPLSLITQLESRIQGKFSYCLTPVGSNSTTKLNFGRNGVVSGKGVVSTPLVPKEPSTFYYLTLESIRVGNKALAFKGPSQRSIGEGNIIIDSGTTLTMLPPEDYDQFESELKQAIDAEPLENPPSPLTLCYDITNGNFEVPPVTVHFTDAEVVLQKHNTFVLVQENVVCLAFVPSQNLAIYGNIAQIDFLVGYDLEAGTVSFKPVDCGQQ